MKTNRLFLAGVLLLLPLLCQAQGLFAKYSDMNNVSSVYISKAMIEMNPELYTKDVNVGKLAKQLELVQILSTMDNGIKREMRRDIESVVRAQKYELLMKQKGIVSRMAFYVKRKGGNRTGSHYGSRWCRYVKIRPVSRRHDHKRYSEYHEIAKDK